MKHSNWTEADITQRHLKRIWAEYQKQHDITERIGRQLALIRKASGFGLAILP